MESNKTKPKTFDYAMFVKEKKVPLPEYVLLKKAFLEGLMITKEWLINIKKNNPEYTDRIDKILNHVNLETVEYDLRVLDTLRTPETEEVFKFLDTQIVVRPSVVTKNPAIDSNLSVIDEIIARPKIVSKEELKIEINQLYQQEDNYDVCLTKTQELLQHPDLTEEEKIRYQTFYQELLEWVNLKDRNKRETAPRPANQPPPSTITFNESRGTAISQLRTDMLKELQKLRNLYIDPSDKK